MIHKDNKKNENQTEGGESVQPIFDGMSRHLKTVLRTELPHLALAKGAISILEMYFDHFEEEILLSVKEAVGDLAFSNYFAICSLSETDGGRWNSILLDDIIFDDDGEERKGLDLITELSGTIEAFNEVENNRPKSANYKLLDRIAKFLALSKEEVINDFVIPNYKVYKTSHIWLEEQTESAFNKAVRKSFGKDFGFWLDIFDDFRESLTDADHVSIFEYFLEGLDLQKLLSSTSLNAEQIKDLLVGQGFINEVEATWMVHPDFVGEILYLQEAYGFCLGEYLYSQEFCPPFFYEEFCDSVPFGERMDEVHELLLTFHQISDLAPEDDVDFPSEARSHHEEVMDFFPNLLEFALATLSRREEWTEAILLEEETFEDY